MKRNMWYIAEDDDSFEPQKQQNIDGFLSNYNDCFCLNRKQLRAQNPTCFFFNG